VKTRLILTIIGIIVVLGILISTSGIFTPLESDLAECSYTDDGGPPQPCRIIDGWYEALFYSKPLPLVEPEFSWEVKESSFEEIMKRKATSAIDLKLQDYGIFFDQLTVQEGFKTSNEPQYFIAEAITKNNTRYYLTTVFYSEEPLEQITVKISKIISDKCRHEFIENGNGCELKYLQEIANQDLELRRIETAPANDPKESFQEKYEAVVEGTIIGCMGHKETYPIRYQCEVQIDSYIKFDGEKTGQLTVLAYRDRLDEDNQKAIFGLDYHEDENYYEVMETGFTRK
jgi:hypothetical protein